MTREYRKSPVLEARRRAEAEELAALHRSGVSVADIARLKNVWPHAIRTKLIKFGLLDTEAAGFRLSVRRNRALAATAKDEMAKQKWGCSFAQYLALRGTTTRAFQYQKRTARDRGIGWEFTLWQWWMVWQESGHWHGRGKSGFVMCRKGDVGPYAIGNVYIATSSQNIKDYWANKRSAEVGPEA